MICKQSSWNNAFINAYIKKNILGKYQYSTINLYINYISLNETDVNKNPNLLYTPVYTDTIRNSSNLVANVNTTVNSTDVIVNYKQTQSSVNQTFQYYYDIIYKRI